MPEEKAKKNTGLIIGIVCGAVAVVAAVVVVLVIVLGNAGGPTKGKYTLTGLQDKDGNDMSAMLSLLTLGGSAPYIEFKDGGKCELSSLSGGFSTDDDGEVTQKEASVTDCTYTKDTISYTEDGKKDEMKFTVEGDKVVFSKDGEKMIFTKK